MTRGSRSNILVRSAERLQGAFERRRAAARADFERLRDEGAFVAPFHPTHGRQAELGLPEPLRPDDSLAEAA
jgi:hypothetical protein